MYAAIEGFQKNSFTIPTKGIHTRTICVARMYGTFLSGFDKCLRREIVPTYKLYERASEILNFAYECLVL